MLMELHALENLLSGIKTAFICNQLDEDRAKPIINVEFSPMLKETCRKFLDNDQFQIDFKKSVRTAMKYGYRGTSNGKKNGIIDIRSEDKPLIKDYSRIMNEFDVEKRYGLVKPTPIKIVAHIPSGNRLIGCLDSSETEFYKGIII